MLLHKISCRLALPSAFGRVICHLLATMVGRPLADTNFSQEAKKLSRMRMTKHPVRPAGFDNDTQFWILYICYNENRIIIFWRIL